MNNQITYKWFFFFFRLQNEWEVSHRGIIQNRNPYCGIKFVRTKYSCIIPHLMKEKRVSFSESSYPFNKFCAVKMCHSLWIVSNFYFQAFNNFGNLWNASHLVPNPCLLFHLFFCASHPIPIWCKKSLGKVPNYALRQKHKMKNKTEIWESYPSSSSCEDWVCAGLCRPSWLLLSIMSTPGGGCVPMCYRCRNSKHSESAFAQSHRLYE